MIRPTRKPVRAFSPGGILAPTEAPRSRFQETEDDPEFWRSFFRYPRHDLAEAVVSLRQLRGMTQADLAARVGTKQPAIARIEAARANVGIDTLRSLSIALDAVVRISMCPVEDLGLHHLSVPGDDVLHARRTSVTIAVDVRSSDLLRLGSGAALESPMGLESDSVNDFALSS